ncbi:hypothetical protein [Vandammella animalimorsus]|uniref:hypothetical protein n=1 Tax=Vandammella animalimorsus TaxID=2029117 RepID=UPI001177D77A|nr:hypothetical protein [Vandammella animalimorsus]
MWLEQALEPVRNLCTAVKRADLGAVCCVLRLAAHPKLLLAHSRRDFEQVLRMGNGPGMGFAHKALLPSAAQILVCAEMASRLLWIIRLLFGGPRPWVLSMRSMP